ncbi:MAG: hypothetical protein JO022_08320 [Acidobacteriaceae bacterium]|nr:hypothetical protein [Acidobacteriaceae bacterium]
MSHHDEILEIPAFRLNGVPKAAGTAAAMLVLFGLIALIAAFVTDATRAWHAYLVNWLYFTSVCAGATMFSAVVVMARGLWSQTIRRISLSFVSFLPVSFVLLLPILFVPDAIFPWRHEQLPKGKELWLNAPFVAGRNVVLFGAFVVVALLFAYWCVRPDLSGIRSEGTDKQRRFYDRLTENWRGQEQEEVRASHKVNTIAPILALFYAFSLSLIAFDFVMSLEHSWRSTLLGGYFFMSSLLGGVAGTAVLTALYRKGLGLEDYISEDSVHDLGKLHFGFNIFWAYLFWAQFLVIWYGILTHEQSFIIRRFTAPYGGIAIAVLFCLFVIPFFGLLGVKPKRTPAILATFSSIVLLGLWLERYLLVYPSYYHQPSYVLPGWQEVGIGFFFAGILISCLSFFGSRFPILQMWRTLPELELLGAPGQRPMEQVTKEGLASG